MALQQPTSAVTAEFSHYVDWGALFAGAVVASAVSVILFSFGAAIGLAMVSPYEGEGASRAVYFATFGLWTLWVVVSSFMAGGYVTGRLRRRIADATEHEVEVRDGSHGLIMWALGIVVASVLFTLGVTGVLGTAAKVGGAAALAASKDNAGLTDYTVDNLFRLPATASEEARGTISPGTGGTDRERTEVARLLTYGTVRGELTADNKAYIARVVAYRTGMSQAEAERRVNEVLADAKAKANAARKLGIILAFFTAAALLVGGAGAAWSAVLGGRHRDRGTLLTAFWSWSP